MSGGALRLFVALELPGPARAALAGWARAAAPDGVRPVREGGLHVTLAFLGAQPSAASAAAVVSALRPSLRPLRTAGALWLPPRRPGVLAVALEPDSALSALHASLTSALAAAVDGWEPDARAFRPHVTVGRVRRGARVRPARLASAAPELDFAATAVTLLRSHPQPGGSRYEPVAQAPITRPQSA